VVTDNAKATASPASFFVCIGFLLLISDAAARTR
jgi:hypothetical protein